MGSKLQQMRWCKGTNITGRLVVSANLPVTSYSLHGRFSWTDFSNCAKIYCIYKMEAKK